MDFFQKNSHVFRISWEIIEGTREEKRKTKRKKEYTQRNPQQKQKESTAKTNPWQKQKESTTKTNSQQKQIHGKNKSTTKTIRIPWQKQIHGKNTKDSTQNGKERRAIRA